MLGLSVFLACGNMPPAISVVNYKVAIYIQGECVFVYALTCT